MSSKTAAAATFSVFVAYHATGQGKPKNLVKVRKL